MKNSLKLICGMVAVATNALAGSTITVCKNVNTSECKTAAESLEHLKIVPNSNSDGGAVTVYSAGLYSKVSGSSTSDPTPPVEPPPTGSGDCPTPLLTQEVVNYPIGSNTQFPRMERGDVLVVKLVPPANHTGKIFWGPAVNTSQTTSKLGVISTCPGVVNSKVSNETIFPCRRSGSESSLWYSTQSNPTFDQCVLQAGKTYYVNIFSGQDSNILDQNFSSYNDCPSGKRCDITLNIK